MSNVEIIYKRYCKDCKVLKEISNYDETTNKKSKNKTYRKVCKDCNKLKRRKYFRKYYLTKILNVDSDESILSEDDKTMKTL